MLVTTNQIAWYNAQENKRHNLATEGESARHNVSTEAISAQSNLIQDWFNRQSALHYERQDAMTKAHNELVDPANVEHMRNQDRINEEHYLRQDKEAKRSNKARERENKRSNIAKEKENYRSNIARERELNRSNLANEELRSAELQEQTLHNRTTENETQWYHNNVWQVEVFNAQEDRRHNLAAEGETARHNKQDETIRAFGNIYSPGLGASVDSTRSGIQVNNARISNLNADTGYTKAKTWKEVIGIGKDIASFVGDVIKTIYLGD